MNNKMLVLCFCSIKYIYRNDCIIHKTVNLFLLYILHVVFMVPETFAFLHYSSVTTQKTMGNGKKLKCLFLLLLSC